MMKDQEYKATQMQMITIGNVAEKIDCLGYLERNSLADTCAPIVDPTLYMSAADNMQALRGLAMAIQQVKTAMMKLRGAVAKTQAAGLMIPPRDAQS